MLRLRTGGLTFITTGGHNRGVLNSTGFHSEEVNSHVAEKYNTVDMLILNLIFKFSLWPHNTLKNESLMEAVQVSAAGT